MNAHWLILFTLSAFAVVLWIVPLLSRPEFFFGVTVSPDFAQTTNGRRIMRRYRVAITAAAIMAIGLSWSRLAPLTAPIWLLVLAGVVFWARCSRMARPFAVTPSVERSAVLGGVPEPPQPSWPVRLGPYAILGTAALCLLYVYRLLPDPLPVHWSGPDPDRFQEKSWFIAFRPLVTAAGLCLLLEVTKATLSNRSWTRRLTGAGSDQREPRFFQLNLLALLGGQYWMAILFAWIALVLRGPLAPDWMSPSFKFSSVLFVAIAPLPVLIYLKFSYGQGGSRLASEAPPAARGDRTPDECWKLGQFYFNPNDAAVWVERRAGFGYTLNLAQPRSWLWIVGTFVGPLILLYVMQ